VLIHDSEFIETKATVVRGSDGVLLIDPGIRRVEMVDIANDLREASQTVVAGFSTHPHWDHLLWHAQFGETPRYGTARCAAVIADLLSSPEWAARIAGVLPPDIADEIPLDLLGLITGLPVGSEHLPWDGPRIRIIEHQGHAPGHAAVLIEEPGVLVAGDMLSDVLIPFLDLRGAADPIEDYLEGLQRIEAVADGVNVVIPGHGSVGGADDLRARIELDRAYVHALRDGTTPDDPRIGSSAKPGWEWMNDVHEHQRKALSRE
jgi:glyoxylase-like metal-dependent hydrolase (beta-lactamase superfamily II)